MVHAGDKASGNSAAEDLSLLDPGTWHTIGSYLGPRVVSSHVEGPCPLAGGQHVWHSGFLSRVFSQPEPLGLRLSQGGPELPALGQM